ncbi:MAG: hypothetical protein K2P80_02820 [Beijerinckiaceae bacterium]|nr:hypothetical protein [Beijerinckiaceae bacterium]
MTPENARLRQLRGGLAAVEVGARGIESIARNADCMRLRAIVIAGLTPNDVIQKVLGEAADIMSPFAMTLTQAFERRLFSNAGGSLLTVYREKGHLDPQDAKIVNVADLAPRDTYVDRIRRERETRRLVDLKMRGDPAAPNLILKPRLTLTIVGVSHAIELDYLVASDKEPFYRVGVIKSYADRGGKTNNAHVRSACREAAVGTLALRQLLEEVGRSADLAGDRVDMVLKAPASFSPRLFAAQRAESELASLIRALAAAPGDLDQIEQMLPAGASLADPAVIESLPNHYCSTCKEHCSLWKHCRAQAQVQGNAIILGDQAAEQLAAAGSLNRAMDLLNGAGRPPDNRAEAVLAAKLHAAALLLERIANG